MKIIFVGSEGNGYFVKEVALAQGYSLSFIEPYSHIKQQEDGILLEAQKGCDVLIYDASQYIDDAAEIADSIAKVSIACSAKPIVIAETISKTSILIQSCLNMDIKSFINRGAGTTSDMKSELIRNITGFYETHERAEIEEIKRFQEEERRNAESIKTIGVVGSCRRIGTTTQAIQIAKYLMLRGYKACVIETNDNLYENRQLTRIEKPKLSFFEKLRMFFEAEIEDAELGYIRYQSTDLYYKPDRIKDIIEKGYDFYVYDHGVYTSNGFNKAAFLKDNINIFCVAAGAAEIDYALEIAENKSYSKSDLLFSFIAEDEYDDTIEFFEGVGAGVRCYFTKYTPDPFVLSNPELYDKLLKIDPAPDIPEPEKKKRSVFGRKGR